MVMASALSLAIIFVLIVKPTGEIATLKASKVYYFNANQDNFYENPANWQPEYPGTHIASDSRLVLESEAYVTGYDLKIEGVLQIMEEASLIAISNKLEIENGAKLFNRGKLLANVIHNAGLLKNNQSAVLKVDTYHALPESHTINLHAGKFNTQKDFINQGRFDNYGLCEVGTEFLNRAEVYQQGRAQIRIRGMLVDQIKNADQDGFSYTFLNQN